MMMMIFVNGEKSVDAGDFEGGQIWYLEVQSQIDSVNILWAWYAFWSRENL